MQKTLVLLVLCGVALADTYCSLYSDAGVVGKFSGSADPPEGLVNYTTLSGIFYSFGATGECDADSSKAKPPSVCYLCPHSIPMLLFLLFLFSLLIFPSPLFTLTGFLWKGVRCCIFLRCWIRFFCWKYQERAQQFCAVFPRSCSPSWIRSGKQYIQLQCQRSFRGHKDFHRPCCHSLQG